MAKLKKMRLSVLLELLLGLLLLATFLVQAVVASCLAVYGYIPLPSELANRLMNEQMPEGVDIHVQEYRLQTDGSVDAIGIEIYAAYMQEALLEAHSAKLELKWRGLTRAPKPDSLVVKGGTLFIPPVYSPSGDRMALLNSIALRVRMTEQDIKIDRFAALHDQIRLRGCIDIPRQQVTAQADIKKSINQYYTQAAKLLKHKERIRDFKTPTIMFYSTPTEDGSHTSFIRVSSPQLESREIQATQIQIETHLSWDGKKLSTIHAPYLTSSKIDIPSYEISSKDISVQISTESVPLLLKGILPRLQLSAKELSIAQFDLDTPILRIDPSKLPELQFSGATRSLDGVIDFSGQLDTDDWSGQIRAKGSANLVKLADDSITKKLPEIRFKQLPHYNLNLNFSNNFTLESAQLHANMADLLVEGISFDHVQAEGSFNDGNYSIDKMYLQREDQWIDVKFNLNTKNDDYCATLIGSAVPQDYNRILPKWWATIFRDFDFANVHHSLSDFIIYGNAQVRAPDLYFGRAEANGLKYKNINLKSAELIVRGRDRYTELHQLKALSEEGWARGQISFTSKQDDIKAPASVRLKMEAKLTLSDASKLFGENITKIIDEFKTDALTEAKLDGVIFNKAYPQYASKGYLNLSARCAHPLDFKNIPLDYLSFDLYGLSGTTKIRNLQFGYAGGKGQASFDVTTPESSEANVRYQIELANAYQKQAIENLPQLNNIEDSLASVDGKNLSSYERKEARVDIQLHGEGPVKDIYAHKGFGQLEMSSKSLGTIQLLGPLSRILQKTQLDFTSLDLNLLRSQFEYTNELVDFQKLQIDGPLTQILSIGKLNLKDQSLDMRLSVNLFKNVGDAYSSIRKFRELISKRLPNLLVFELTGTIQEQTLRSVYDPRNLIPIF